MSFLRPEALATLTRWREALVGVGAGLLGAYWMIGPGQLLAIPGAGLLIAGAALIWMGVQRGRFRGQGGGAGQVTVDEGQISYFGPLTGGVVSLRELDRLSLVKSLYPDHWKLEQAGQPPVLIPVNALGSDALFDAFTTLQGLKTETMLAALREEGDAPRLIWEASSRGTVRRLN